MATVHAEQTYTTYRRTVEPLPDEMDFIDAHLCTRHLGGIEILEHYPFDEIHGQTGGCVCRGIQVENAGGKHAVPGLVRDERHVVPEKGNYVAVLQLDDPAALVNELGLAKFT